MLILKILAQTFQVGRLKIFSILYHPCKFLYVCFYLLVNYYFEVSFCLKAILNVAKISQNVAIELLKATIFWRASIKPGAWNIPEHRSWNVFLHSFCPAETGRLIAPFWKQNNISQPAVFFWQYSRLIKYIYIQMLDSFLLVSRQLKFRFPMKPSNRAKCQIMIIFPTSFSFVLLICSLAFIFFLMESMTFFFSFVQLFLVGNVYYSITMRVQGHHTMNPPVTESMIFFFSFVELFLVGDIYYSVSMRVPGYHTMNPPATALSK